MTDRPGEPPLAGTEVTALTGALERGRTIFRWKADGLGGLLKHLALVEDHYFTQDYDGTPAGAPWTKVDWDSDPDWAWTSGSRPTGTEPTRTCGG
jgi:hypothetical protein